MGNLRSDRALLPTLMENVLNRAVELNEKTVKTYPEDTSTNKVSEKETRFEKSRIKYVYQGSVHIPFDKSELITEEDVLQYVMKMQEVFLKQIKDNKRIRL